MCVIIIKQKTNLIPSEVLENSARINPHGLGITFLDTFETTYHKSTEFELLLTERPFIAHFRYATVGKVGLSNTHPFVCGKASHELLMQNGTIKGLGTKAKCDSKVLAESLGDVPREDWKDELAKYESRFVSINTKARTFQIYNRELYIKKDGVWYSKANVFQNNVVAVYGTLKRGHSNSQHYLRSSRFVGSGVTQDKYPLVISGLPYLLSNKGIGHNVEVDVFRVDDNVFTSLDQLEGHPIWYRREETPIKMDDGSVVNAWVYFNDTERVKTGSEKHHKTYPVKAKKQVYISGQSKPFAFRSHEPQPIKTLWDDYEFEVDSPELEPNDSPFCVDCYNDLVKEEFPGGSYTCIGCGGEFTDEEVLKFNF